MVTGALIVFVIAAMIAGYLALKPRPAPEKPLLASEFAESFMSLDKWKAPSSWSFARQSLQIENEPAIGYAPEVNCADFTMVFHLKLMNDGGAAWALRVKDPDNYYLFYLSGPGGMNRNTFFTYLIQDGKRPVQKQADPVIVRLAPGGEYDIQIEVKNDLIRQTITSDQIDDDDAGSPKTLGLFRDETFHTGSIGFRTYGAEKFVVSGLYVRPPSVELPH